MSCYTTGNTGQQYCTTEAIFGDPIGIILALDGTNNEFSAANFLLETTWETGINARRLFPIMGIKDFADNSVEPTYYEYPNKDRKLIDQGKYRFSFGFNVNQKVKKELFDFQGYSQKIFFLYNDNVIRGRTTDSGVTIKGMRVEQMNVNKEKQNPFGEVPMMYLDVDMKDYKDLNQYDYAMEVAWEVGELDGLTEVDLAANGATGATAIPFTVYASCYGEDKPITGITFAMITYSGSGESSLTDNGDGSYILVGTGMTSGNLNLATPAVIGAIDPDLFIISSGALAITI